MTRSASMLQAWQQGLRRLIQGQSPGARAYRAFDLVLARRISLSPSFARLVFTGPDIELMHTLAPDQRVKLLFPAPDGSLPTLPHNVHWKTAHSALPAEQRPPMRTYTIRALRPDALEVDVDFVLHGVNGPASAWASHAQEGDRLVMVAPNLAYSGDPGGYEWKPPQGTRHVLLIGDETALPAIAGILEALAEQQPELAVEAFIEVPQEADCLPLRHSANTRLHWLPRDLLRCEQGQSMQHAVRELASLPLERAFYAWVAGESATVLEIRRYLTKQRGLQRDRLMTMGYWRLGESCD